MKAGTPPTERTMPVTALPSLPIDEIPAAVVGELEAFLDERAASISLIGTPVAEALQRLRAFVLRGGKRVRPLYGWVGYVGGGGLRSTEDPSAALRAVAALEFIQACALIHDDIIDSSDTRRGQPTVHRDVEARHHDARWRGDSGSFGRSIATLIGDLALVYAEDMLQDSGLSSAALNRAREPWRAMREEVIGGQILDVSLEASGEEDEAAAEAVNRFKTAAYTIERPLHLGAAIAGASDAVIGAFRRYGRDVGIAYQLRDDLLGVFGDPEITGKPAGDDIREGKRTVLLARALARCDRDAAHRIRAGIGSADPTIIDEVTAIIAASGAVDDMNARIDALVSSGIQALDAAPIDSDTRGCLERLAVLATSRRR